MFVARPGNMNPANGEKRSAVGWFVPEYSACVRSLWLWVRRSGLCLPGSMNWFGRIGLIFLGVLLILVVLLLVRWNTASKEDPDATFIVPRMLVSAFHVRDHDLRSTHIDMVLVVENPAPVGLRIDSLTYKLGIEEEVLIESAYAERIDIDAFGTDTVRMPVVIDSQRLLERLRALEEQGLDSVHYHMDARFHSPLAFWRKKPLEMHRDVLAPLVKIPRVRLDRTRLDDLGLRKSNAMVDLALYNGNVFPFSVKDVDVKVRMGDGQVFAARIDSTVHVPREDTVAIALPVTLAPGQLIQALFSALLKPSRTPFDYDVSLVIVSDQPALNNCEFAISGQSTVAELRKDLQANKD